MSVLIRNGGGASKIKVDGIPPKKKMELSSVGNEDYFNFIKLNNSLEEADVEIDSYIMEDIRSFIKIEDYIYVLTGYKTSITSPPLTLIRYNLKTGWDKYFGIETEITCQSNRDNVSIVSINNNEELLISSYEKIVKINLKNQNITDFIITDYLHGEYAKLFKLKEEVYMLATKYLERDINNVYKIDIENKEMAQVATLNDWRVTNIFTHNDSLWINNSSGYCLFRNGEITNTGKLPESGSICIKINKNVHSFYMGASNSRIVGHYILNDDGTWTKKVNLKKENININQYVGLNTDIGYIQANTDYDAFEILTSDLFLEKRKE